MKKCALCGVENANKTNTHYLSDNIIRNALNKNGKSKRGYGSYCELSTVAPFINYRFQQGIQRDNLIENFKRDPYEKEIAYARKNIAFSVDNVFCSNCEDLFGQIEKKFNDNVLARLRDASLKPGYIRFNDNKIIRQYCYLQIWRSHICDSYFKIDEKLASSLKNAIVSENNVEAIPLPLSMSYMITPSDIEHTENSIGYIIQKNPYVIFMNEFVIQLFDNLNAIKYDSLFGVNDESTYKDFINYRESSFILQIIDNERRKCINHSMATDFAKQKNTEWINKLIEYYVRKYGKYPPANVIQLFEVKISSRTDFYMNMYSEEVMLAIFKECCNNRF